MPIDHRIAWRTFVGFTGSLAWSGVLQGVADKIKANAEKLQPGDLLDTSNHIATRLTAWHTAEEGVLDSAEKSPDAKTPAKPK